MGGTSSLHQMKLSAGTLLSQTGTHLPMVSCKVLGEAGTKVLKGCVTMRVLRGEPLRVGHRQHGTGCANHSAITFLWKKRRPCVGIQQEAQGHEQPQKGPLPLSLCVCVCARAPGVLYGADLKFMVA